MHYLGSPDIARRVLNKRKIGHQRPIRGVTTEVKVGIMQEWSQESRNIESF